MVTVTYPDGSSATIPIEQFRRLTICADHVLTSMKQTEGGTFPAIDRQTLEWIRHQQFLHRELV